MREKLENAANVLLLPINPALVVVLGIYTVVWGLWVANPFWTVFNRSEIYMVLGSVAPEVFWGCLAMVAGSITIYGAVRRRYKPLINGAMTAAWHWAMISLFYFLGDPGNTAGITALVFAVYAILVYLNIRVNFKDDRKSDKILH